MTPARRATDAPTYTTPAARMAEAAALLLSNPSTNIPALVQALTAPRGIGPARLITELLHKEASK